MFQKLKLLMGGDPRLCGASRSPQWSGVRDAFIAKNPKCAACGGGEKLQAHHVVPFSQDRSKELDTGNLITLCECDAHPCHYIFGHLGQGWDRWNVHVREHSQLHLQAIQEWNRLHK